MTGGRVGLVGCGWGGGTFTPPESAFLCATALAPGKAVPMRRWSPPLRTGQKELLELEEEEATGLQAGVRGSFLRRRVWVSAWLS